jgi:hypothetical protein
MLRRIIITISLALMLSSARGPDVVERTIDLFSNGGSFPQERVQGIPRESIIPMNDTGMDAVYMSRYVSVFNEHLLKFSEHGATLDDSISTDSTCRNHSGCLNVPASHGDRAYLHYICHDGTSWKNRMVVVVDSSTAPSLPAENISVRLKGVK